MRPTGTSSTSAALDPHLVVSRRRPSCHISSLGTSSLQSTTCPQTSSWRHGSDQAPLGLSRFSRIAPGISQSRLLAAQATHRRPLAARLELAASLRMTFFLISQMALIFPHISKTSWRRIPLNSLSESRLCPNPTQLLGRPREAHLAHLRPILLSTQATHRRHPGARL